MISARIFGGSLATFGGILVLVVCLINIALGGINLTQWLINLLIALVGTVGGILGLANKRSGGGLALIAGLVAIICQIIFYINFVDFAVFSQYLLLEEWLSFVIPYFTLEGILITLGGICILAGKSK